MANDNLVNSLHPPILNPHLKCCNSWSPKNKLSNCLFETLQKVENNVGNSATDSFKMFFFIKH